MAETKQLIVMSSVLDTIQILESHPVGNDMVPQFIAMKLANRVSIAHLSIERALKSLIVAAGGQPKRTHNLARLYRELRIHDPESTEYLDGAFDGAVQHYRYNPNAVNMAHLKTLERYLEVAGSDQAFQGVRYWELEQSLDAIFLRQIHLVLHLELLHALNELLLAPQRPKDTVATRVERAISRAMIDNADLAYGTGSPKESSVKGYIRWLQGFGTRGEALGAAVQSGFNLGGELAENVVRKAYRTLLDSSDPAVRYYAITLDVLPPQSREILPPVEWLGPETERAGSISTPAGTPLGIIERGHDGLWYITSLRGGLLGVSPKARCQTDARAYLAQRLSLPVQVTVDGQQRSLRLVGEESYPYEQNHDEIRKRFEGTGDDSVWTHKVVLWGKDHEIKVGDSIILEVPAPDLGNVVHRLTGRVTEVVDHLVYISGEELFALAEDKP